MWLQNHHDELVLVIVRAVIGGVSLAVPLKCWAAFPETAGRLETLTVSQTKSLWCYLGRLLAKVEIRFHTCLRHKHQLCGAAEKWAMRAARDLEILPRPWADMGAGSVFAGLQGGILGMGITRSSRHALSQDLGTIRPAQLPKSYQPWKLSRVRRSSSSGVTSLTPASGSSAGALRTTTVNPPRRTTTSSASSLI